jgi:hypothetical protein
VALGQLDWMLLAMIPLLFALMALLSARSGVLSALGKTL